MNTYIKVLRAKAGSERRVRSFTWRPPEHFGRGGGVVVMNLVDTSAEGGIGRVTQKSDSPAVPQLPPERGSFRTATP